MNVLIATSNVGLRLDEIATKYPDKPALILAPGPNRRTERVIPYRELLDHSNRIARGLSSIEAVKGMRASLMAPPNAEFFAIGFALLRAGIVPVIVDPGIGLKSVTECIAECEPEIFIGSPAAHMIRHGLGWGKASVQVNITVGGNNLLGRRQWGGMSLEEVERNGQDAPPITVAPTNPDDEAAIIYTSGSTGLPKGAIYTHGNFAAQIDLLRATFPIHPDEIDLPAFPLFALIDFLVGVTAVVPDMRFPRPADVDPSLLIRTIEDYEIANMFGSPVVIEKIGRYAEEHHLTLPTLKRVITAGAPASADSLERFRKLLPPEAGLFGIYGATEILPISCVESGEILEETRYLTAEGAGVCVGRPVAGAGVRIIQISDEPISTWDNSLQVPRGQIGEIAVKGPAVTAAYAGRPEANTAAKIRDADDQGIHRMGDVGYIDEEGRLWYCGRKAHRVITPEGTLFTECVEGIFNVHPQVSRTALVGVLINGVTTPVLCVELKKSLIEPDTEAIRTELLALGAEHPMVCCICKILFHSGFPTDIRHNSKIIREKLAVWAQEKLIR